MGATDYIFVDNLDSCCACLGRNAKRRYVGRVGTAKELRWVASVVCRLSQAATEQFSESNIFLTKRLDWLTASENLEEKIACKFSTLKFSDSCLDRL